ncbi:CoA transferase subunit A [Pseudonocardia acaciae]|uniref:CoA transferase subunit A n=1 Tax=Pseudonocardia acaciae TaxID=551276 RepID=UPI00048BC113|nr:CoA-transferase [Pseudonocardia acaciae]
MTELPMTGGRPVLDKVTTAAEAVGLVRDGDHVAVGGTNYSRTPMALVFELLRQRRTGLTVSRPLSCFEAELLLATGTADTLMTSWVGIGHGWGLARVVRHFVESGSARFEEWSHLALGMRYRAAAMGVPFLPTSTMLGSDLVERTGARTVTCPYTEQTLLAVPALHPDVAFLHVQRADRYGNAQIDGYPFMDVDMAYAARRVVLSAEEIVEPELLRREPTRTVIPHFAVDAVVHQPYGSYPHECYGGYEVDAEHFTEYMNQVREHGVEGARRYVDAHVRAHADFAGFLATVGPERLARRRRGAQELMPA